MTVSHPGHEMTEPETPEYVLVILPAQKITLPEILRHIEAGRIVLLIPRQTSPQAHSPPRTRQEQS
jgi:hypothetical protein